MEAEKIVALGLEIVHREVEALHQIAQKRRLGTGEAKLLMGYLRISLDSMEVDLPVFTLEMNVSRMSLTEISAALEGFIRTRAIEIGNKNERITVTE